MTIGCFQLFERKHLLNKILSSQTSYKKNLPVTRKVKNFYARFQSMVYVYYASCFLKLTIEILVAASSFTEREVFFHHLLVVFLLIFTGHYGFTAYNMIFTLDEL